MKNDKLPQTPYFPDISRYTRWLNEMKENEKRISPKKRQLIWGFVMGVLFVLYITSFFQFPDPAVGHQPLNPLPATGKAVGDSLKKEKSMTFDMPVDSFEQYLKKVIHEKLPE